MVSDGSPWRPLVHILDICEAIHCALRAPADAVSGKVFNVGHDSENYRVREIADIVAAVATQHDVTIEVSGGFGRPPKPLTPEAEALFNLVKQAGTDLGQTIAWQATGGVCDGNNIAACGVPVVDTMGVRGGKIHSMEEFLIVDSLPERAALSALTILRLATGAA